MIALQLGRLYMYRIAFLYLDPLSYSSLCLYSNLCATCLHRINYKKEKTKLPMLYEKKTIQADAAKIAKLEKVVWLILLKYSQKIINLTWTWLQLENNQSLLMCEPFKTEMIIYELELIHTYFFQLAYLSDRQTLQDLQNN